MVAQPFCSCNNGCIDAQGYPFGCDQYCGLTGFAPNKGVDEGYSDAACTNVLPVELTSFTITQQAKTFLLQWQTVSETDNAGFEIQSSKDGQNWRLLDFVKGNGTTIETQDYKWYDEQPLSGVSYYRLKQVDTDGEYEYSAVIAANFKEEKDSELVVFPNPATQDVLYQVNDIDEVKSVQLFDLYGKLLKTDWTIDGNFALDGVDAGMYLLVVNTGAEQLHQMVVKK